MKYIELYILSLLLRNHKNVTTALPNRVLLQSHFCVNVKSLMLLLKRVQSLIII
jgi:hypothetical protein